jgi:hypothetical protein
LSNFYNVAQKDISNGLNDEEISNGHDYFILLSAPTNANVRVKLNNTSSSEIPLKEFWQINAKDISNIYISCDAVAGESIIFGQGNGDFKITTNPTINAIDSITTVNNFGSNLLTELDKVINPYDTSNILTVSVSSTSTSNITLLQEVLNCDKIILNLEGGAKFDSSGRRQIGFITAYLDNEQIFSDGGYYAYYGVGKTSSIEFKGVRGKTLKINCQNYNNTYTSSAYLQKFNLKE